MDERLVFEPLLERDGVTVSRSPWGPDDEIGRLNWVTPDSVRRVLGALDGQHVFDLSVDFSMDMPAWTHFGDPPYNIWMTHTPSGSIADNLSGAGREVHERYSYCGDSISMYTHCGTHIDTLVHLGYCGTFWNGFTIEEHLGSRCWTVGGADRYPPLVARGVLLDVAGLHGVDCLPDGYQIGPEDIAKAAREHRLELRRGDVVHIRTGRMTLWPKQEYLAVPMPGINMAGARHLCEEAGAMVIGSDTAALEAFPSDAEGYAPVHCYMFATAGTPIVENLWLEELAAARRYEFALISPPLKMRGATGAFMRPLAVPLRSQVERLRFEPILERDGLQVSRSPWGPDDQIGRLNWVTPASTRRIIEALAPHRVFDLAVEGLHEFAYVAASLKLRGATGSFLRPLAIPLRAS